MKDSISKVIRDRFTKGFIAGFLWGIVISFIVLAFYLRYSLICEYPSGKSFEATCFDLSAQISSAKGWSGKNSGCPLPKPADGTQISTLDLCNAKFAEKILTDIENRRISSILPCKFSVYEKNNGKTYIGRLNTWLVGIIIGGDAGKILNSQVAPEQEKMIRDTLKKTEE